LSRKFDRRRPAADRHESPTAAGGQICKDRLNHAVNNLLMPTLKRNKGQIDRPAEVGGEIHFLPLQSVTAHVWQLYHSSFG
jgi:hypothetical protein